MKIVLIQKEETETIGGIEVYNQRLREYLLRNGHEVYILRFAKKEQKDPNVFRIPYHIDLDKNFFILLPSTQTLGIIHDYLKRIKPDIVYTCIGMSPWDFFLPALCKQLHIPLSGVWHVDFHNATVTYRLGIKSLFAAYLPFCLQLDLLHVFSSKLKTFYATKGVNHKKIVTIPNGVNTNRYAPGPSRFAKKHNIENGILFLGRLTDQKDPESLIQAFLKLRLPEHTKLILIGSGDKEKKLKEKYNNKNIIFTGQMINESQKIDIMRSCQIYVLPSKFEGAPIALLEAMSTGLACITTNVGSNDMVVKNVGIILSSQNIKSELQKTLQHMLTHPEYTQRLGKNARTKILEHFNEEKTFSYLIGAFKKTIHKK